MKPYRLALVVGKFAPLHRGHEALIAAAQAAADAVLVLSYSRPELPGCTPARRRQWLQARAPLARVEVLDQCRLDQLCGQRGIARQRLIANAADDASHHAFLAWLLGEVLALRPDALFANEHYAAACAAHLSAAWRQPVTAVLPDPDRRALPISASRIRSDVHAHRQWLAHEVYASFVQRVAILGGESSGKTTLAAALAARWRSAWVPEFGREFWQQRGGALRPQDLPRIAAGQIHQEQTLALTASRYLFCDTTPLTTFGYAHWYFGLQPKALARLARRRYAHTILCAPDFTFVQDGTRRDAAFRHQQQAWYRQRLAQMGIAFVEVAGPISARLAQLDVLLRE